MVKKLVTFGMLPHTHDHFFAKIDAFDSIIDQLSLSCRNSDSHLRWIKHVKGAICGWSLRGQLTPIQFVKTLACLRPPSGKVTRFVMVRLYINPKAYEYFLISLFQIHSHPKKLVLRIVPISSMSCFDDLTL